MLNNELSSIQTADFIQCVRINLGKLTSDDVPSVMDPAPWFWEQWFVFAQISLQFGTVIGVFAISINIFGLLQRRRIAIEDG